MEHDTARAGAQRMGVNLVLFQEPDKKNAEVNAGIVDEKVDVAVA